MIVHRAAEQGHIGHRDSVLAYSGFGTVYAVFRTLARLGGVACVCVCVCVCVCASWVCVCASRDARRRRVCRPASADVTRARRCV